MPDPTFIDLPSSDPVTAIALVLHGGRENSFQAAGPTQAAAMRMRPIARAIHRRGAATGLAVSSLIHLYRGWNGEHESPVADARWALSELRRRHGNVPIVVVGHSMGGRTALRVADDESVVGVVALAPWLTPSDPYQQLVGKRTLIAHGNLDFVTSPRMSHKYADRARNAGADITYRVIHGDVHAMLWRAATWHRLAARTTLDFLGAA